MKKPVKIKESAQILALQALGWLVAHDELLPVFLASSGASLEDLSSRAGEDVFLVAVLDFILMDDEWVLACAASLEREGAALWEARQALEAPLPHWT